MTIKVVCLIAVLVLCASADYTSYCQAPLPKYIPPSNGLTLRQVAVFSRHGDRSPIHALPHQRSESKVVWTCDQHIISGTNTSGNGDIGLTYASYMPLNNIWASKQGAWHGNCYPGQLTKKGAVMTYQLGQALREVYVNQFKLLPATLDSSLLYLRATHVPRAQQSLFSIIQGLYPAATRRTPQTAIPFHVVSDAYETLLPNSGACPRINQLHKIARQQSGWEKELKKTTPIINKAVSITGTKGSSLDSPNAVTSWLDVLYTRLCNDMPLPCKGNECITKGEANTIGDVATYIVNHEYDVNTSGCGYEAAKLTAGPMLQELLGFQEKMIGGDPAAPRYVHFSAHDTTLIPLMAALQNHAPDYIPYASTIIFELFESKVNNGNFFIRAMLNNKPLLIPGCWNTVCPFNSFKHLVDTHLTIKDASKECASK